MNENAPKSGGIFSGGRVPELDGLRGTAILLVILCHYVGDAEHRRLGILPHRFLGAFGAGWTGVDLFFVLSGFLIGGILLNARETPHYFRAFYMRRVHRILPIYYLWTVLFVVVVLVSAWLRPGAVGIATQDLARVPVQLLFLQNVFMDMPTFAWMWFAVTWSLAVEEQFYLVAPWVIRYVTRKNLVTTLALVMLLAPVLRLLVLRYAPQGAFFAALSTPCRADALACGVLLSIGWKDARFREFVDQKRAWLRRAVVVLFAGVAALSWWLVHPLNTVTVLVGYSWLAIFYGTLLLTAISQTEGRIASMMRWPFLRWLGGISYCVYLLHGAFNCFAHLILLHARPALYDAKTVAVTALALCATLLVASVSWRYFEKPLIQRGHRYSYGDSQDERGSAPQRGAEQVVPAGLAALKMNDGGG